MDNIIHLRQDIDAIDEKILDLLAQRQTVAQKIARYKKQKHLPIKDQQRFTELLSQRISSGQDKWLDEIYIKKLFSLIHWSTIKAQKYE